MEYDLKKYKNPVVICYGSRFSPFTLYNLKVVEDLTNDIYNSHNKERDIILYFIPTSDKFNSINVKSSYINGNSNKERIKMLEIVCNILNKKNKHIQYKISDNEIKKKNAIYTYDTVRNIQQFIYKKSDVAILNNDIQVILNEDRLREMLKGEWNNALSLLSKNIIVVPTNNNKINTADLFKNINLKKMISNEKYFKDKNNLELLIHDRDYLMSKFYIYNKMTKQIMDSHPLHIYNKLQDFYNRKITMAELNTYLMPEISAYIVQHNLYKKNNKTRKNK